MCAHMNFPTPTRNSWMPARCQRLELSSDTIYREIESDSTGTGLCPTRPLSTSDQSQAQVATCTSHWLALNQGFPWSPLGSKSEVPMISSWGSVNLLEWLIELRKTRLLTRLPSYYKRIILHAHSCPTLCNPMELQPARLLYSWDSLGKNTGVGCHTFLHKIFGTCVSYVSCISRWVLYN